MGDGGFIAQAMHANSFAEATQTGEMISAEGRLGDRFRFLNAVFADSDFEGQLPFFAICDVIDAKTGEVAKLTCGGGRVVATLFKACKGEWFPLEASFAAVDLGSGKAALNLVPAPQKVGSSKAS